MTIQFAATLPHEKIEEHTHTNVGEVLTTVRVHVTLKDFKVWWFVFVPHYPEEECHVATLVI